jgi:dTMP kinase
MCPIDDSTVASEPRNEEIVRAFVGDSTITRLFAIGGQLTPFPGQMSIFGSVSGSMVTVSRVSKYIALEGVDGSGKSTVGKAVVDRLNASGAEAILVREPGGTPLGEAIRGLLLDSEHLDDWAEVFLFAAQRAELAREVIAPALAAGVWVVSDRSYYSSIAYQGRARGLGESQVRAINETGLDGTLPDHVFVLDVEPDLGLSRQNQPDRIGMEGVSFQVEVRSSYLDLAKEEAKVVILDGALSVDEMADQIMEIVDG